MKTTPFPANFSLGIRLINICALVALAAMTACTLAGCTSGDHNSAKIDPSGVYSLVSVDDKPVPCEVMHGETAMTIKSGVFTIDADGTCSSLMSFSVAGNEDVSREVKATYTATGSELTMKWERAGTTIGQVEGNRFTMNNEGMVLAYEK